MSGAHFADGGAFMQGAGSLWSAGRFCGYALFVECWGFYERCTFRYIIQ